MLMVIFGAGASYDSDPTRRAPVAPQGPEHVANSDRPPLANELFDNRPQFAEALGSLPDCRPIVPFLRGTTNIEQQLERLQQEVTEPPAYAARHRQLSAVRWYLQVALSACDERWYVG